MHRVGQPEDIAAAWAKAGRKGGSLRRKWDKRLKESDQSAEFKRALKGELEQVKARIASESAERQRLETTARELAEKLRLQQLLVGDLLGGRPPGAVGQRPLEVTP